MMPKWIDDLFRNIDVWILRRLHKLLQHGGTDFAVSLDTLHAELAQKEQYRDGVYLHLRERLEGTDEHPLAEGVPVRPLPATQDLEHLQEAVELLDSRKVDVDGISDIKDGQFLVPLLADSSVRKTIGNIHDSVLITINKQYAFEGMCENKVIQLDGVTIINAALTFYGCLAEEIILPNLVTIYGGNSFENCTNVLKIIIPKWSVRDSDNDTHIFNGCYKLRELNIEGLDSFGNRGVAEMNYCYNLIKIYIKPNVNSNYVISPWSPTMALRTDTTASDYIDLREDKDDSGEFIYQNNLQQFLSNFKNYIADRLADRSQTTALTLTLSQAVYDAIQADTEFAIVATITAKNWNITH